MSNKLYADVGARVRDRERLMRLQLGGARERPMRVTSAAIIEPRVAAMTCPHCGGTYRLQEHEMAAPGVRRVDVTCRQCSAPRTIWFRLVSAELN